MPVPLIWLGAGIAALYAGDKLVKSNQESRQRVHHFPGEGTRLVKPVDGALVCCGIFGMFDHTGIWVDGDIIELKGNGLIRGISPERFMTNRSGEQIYILCDAAGNALVAPNTQNSAVAKLYQYSEYHVISNNCHRFVWNCISGDNKKITSFKELNDELHQFFQCSLSWQILE